MWVWAVRCAVLLNNITACYFSRERVWATPYELLHGEPFPDVSIVVPFGCAALVFRVFHNRCTLLIFIHYADEHSMYTYAFYSPLTKRVLYRQDCIFLPEIFPMRTAHQAAGLRPEELELSGPFAGIRGSRFGEENRSTSVIRDDETSIA